MKSRNSIVICLFLILLAIPASAEETGIGAWLVVDGLTGFFYAVGDAIYGIGNSTASREQTESMMIDVLSYQVNPYSIPEVRIWMDYVAYGYYIIALLLLIFTFGIEIINPSIFNKIIDARSTQNRFLSVSGYIIIIPVIANYGLWTVLELNRLVCQIIVNSLILALPPTANNFVVYLFLAIVTILLMGVFLIRGIMIVIAATVAVFIVIEFFASDYRAMIKAKIISFLKIVFLQPRLLFYFCIGAIFINQIPAQFVSIQPFAYVALSYLILKKGYTAVLGEETVAAITKIVRMV